MGRETATACYRELGEELRKRRRAAGMSGLELACEIGWSATKISRIETGQYNTSVVDMVQYLGFCGVYRPQALEMIAICREAERKLGYWLSLPDSFRSLIYHESTAHKSIGYEPLLVPGLLQTADYARARIATERWRSPENVDECVRLRMERQQILHWPRPTPVSFFVHEQALRLQVGSAAIMHEQLLKVVLLAALSHITVRVLPSSAGERSVVGGPFWLFGYARHAPLVYLDHHASGLFLEDRGYVEPYRKLVPALAEVALDVDQSRELIAALASEYDQRSQREAGHR